MQMTQEQVHSSTSIFTKYNFIQTFFEVLFEKLRDVAQHRHSR